MRDKGELFGKSGMLKAKAKVTQLCLTLCNPMDFTVHGILQAGILEWVAYPLSFNLWVGNIPWSRKWQLAPVFLPGKFHE